MVQYVQDAMAWGGLIMTDQDKIIELQQKVSELLYKNQELRREINKVCSQVATLYNQLFTFMGENE